MRINRDIRAEKVRVIGPDGKQLGIIPLREALILAEKANLDLVEVAPSAMPPVCKIIDYGKFRYQQTKKEKENKKAQLRIKVKEIKLTPNINEHDLQTKIKRIREFLEKGNKVSVSITFRGREVLYHEAGRRLLTQIFESVNDIGLIDAPMKMLGRTMILILAPSKKSTKTLKEKKEKEHAKSENT